MSGQTMMRPRNTASGGASDYDVAPRHGVTLASAVILAAAFYRPLTFWAVNAWDLSSPLKPLGVGAAAALVGLAVLVIAVRLGMQPVAAGVGFGGLLLLFSHWHHFQGPIGLALASLILILVWVSHRARYSMLPRWLAVTMVTAFGLVPLVQLGVAHLEDAEPYPLLDLPPPTPAVPSGSVEDVVLVIVDSYPNLRLAKEWFGHEPDGLLRDLESVGFVVPQSSWSRHTFTSLSVSSILELASVIAVGPTEPWGNRSSLWHILRGENLVAQTLGNAGFKYTHIESGWDGTSCGPRVDECVSAPWLDEQMLRLLEPTIAHDWLETREFTLTGTLSSAAALEDSLPSLLSNGTHDYVFAHLLLPHSPLLVDGSCVLRDDLDRPSTDWATEAARTSDQMGCVDRLLSEIIEPIDDDTAVLLTGDHGTATGSQVGAPPQDWSDPDIAERFGVFMAYHLPVGCEQAPISDPMTVMATVISCTVGFQYTVEPPVHLIGAEHPVAVDATRMARIQAQVLAGELAPEAE